MKSGYILVVLLACFGCQPSAQNTSMPSQKQSNARDASVVLKVGVAKDGMLKQQVVRAYKTKTLAEHSLVVRAGATLTILESVDGASRVHFATEAKTPDYKTTIKQSEAIGWVATDEIVRIKGKQKDAQQD